MSENNKFKNILVKTLFIIGIIIVILVLAFSIIQIVPRFLSSFATVGDVVNSPFSSNKLEIEASDENGISGEELILAWRYEPEESGIYEFIYSCANYLEIKMGTSEGDKVLKCNTIYNLNSSTRTLSIVPTISKDNIIVDTRFDVRYVNALGKALAKDNITLSIKKQIPADELAGSGSVINTEVINTAPVTPTNTTSNRTNTQSSPSSYYPQNNAPRIADLRAYDIVAINNTTVSFSVSNIGSLTTGFWYFNYRMPDGDIQLSPRQNPLNPGDAIRYTLRFEDVPAGQVTVTVDPSNFIYETLESNNTVTTFIYGDSNGYGYNSDYDYDRNDDADLKVDEVEVGRISGSRFVEDDEIDEDDEAAVRIVIVNIGGESTGTWRFEIDNAPYSDSDDQNYRSSRQSSLRPGEAREIIVRFDRPDEGIYNIKVTADSDDDVDEEKESNNTRSERLEVRD